MSLWRGFYTWLKGGSEQGKQHNPPFYQLVIFAHSKQVKKAHVKTASVAVSTHKEHLFFLLAFDLKCVDASNCPPRSIFFFLSNALFTTELPRMEMKCRTHTCTTANSIRKQESCLIVRIVLHVFFCFFFLFFLRHCITAFQWRSPTDNLTLLFYLSVCVLVWRWLFLGFPVSASIYLWKEWRWDRQRRTKGTVSWDGSHVFRGRA